MSNNLEEYIKANKKAFDVASPPGDLWSRIEIGLEQDRLKKPLRVPFWFSIAASFTVIITFIFIYTYRNRTRELDIADINPSYAKKEIKFATLIEEKKDSLMVFATSNPDLYKKFSQDLNDLAADYTRLKEELQTSPNKKIVVKAMVRNLEIQLQIINQQLSIINEVDQYKKENSI